MRTLITLLIVSMLISGAALAQDTRKMRAELETSPDPIGLVKKWKKKYRLDTIVVVNSTYFMGLADSISYKGRIGQVFGPFPQDKILVKIMGKAKNTYYRFSQIQLDTSIYRPVFADSLAEVIIKKIKNRESSFEDMARTYTMDGNGRTGGDMGWTARGSSLPDAEKAILSHKKGDVFKLKARGGVYVIKITQTPKTDNGIALLLRVFL